MMVKCKKCGTVFEVTGTKTLLVLTGGLDCPECGKEFGVNIVIAEMKK